MPIDILTHVRLVEDSSRCGVANLSTPAINYDYYLTNLTPTSFSKLLILSAINFIVFIAF